MTSIPVPPGWGEDSLSSWIEQANQNSLHVFVHQRDWFLRLQGINDTFRLLSENLDDIPEWFVAAFVPSTHYAYLAAVRLGTSGQLVPAHTALRACLENALYALHLNDNQERCETYLKRHDDKESMKRMKAEFRITHMLAGLEARDSVKGGIARTLYNLTIDWGAHPNPQALLMMVSLAEDGEKLHIRSDCFNGDELPLTACLKSIALVGICALDIFMLIFPERFNSLGIPERLNELREGL